MQHVVAFFGVLGVLLMIGSMFTVMNDRCGYASRPILGWILAGLGSVCLAIGAAAGV